MNNKMYLNGKPLNMLQKIMATGIGIMVLIATFTIGIFAVVIGGAVALCISLYIMWKTRKFRAEIRRQRMQQSSQEAKNGAFDEKTGRVIDGDFKEL